MPNPIDRCGSCGQNVYQEERVAGGCGCPERGMRLLLAAQRQRNAGTSDFANAYMTSTAPSGPLPDLDPGLFMSPTGRNEFEAARQVPQMAPRVASQAQPVRGRTQIAAQIDDANFDVDLGGDDWTGDWQGRQPVSTEQIEALPQVDLAAMWMQGSGIPFDPGQLVAAPGDDFEFTTDLDMSDHRGRTASSGGGRFRVDQPPPQRPAFDRGLVGGPTREVGRVRERFAVIMEERAQARPVQPPPPPVVEREVSVPAPKLSAIQQARMLQAKPGRSQSTYDRLRQNPFKDK